MKSPRPGLLAQGFLSLSFVSFFLPSLSSYMAFIQSLPSQRFFFPQCPRKSYTKIKTLQMGSEVHKEMTVGVGRGEGEGGTRPWGHSRPLSGLVDGLAGVSVVESLLSQHPFFGFLAGR